MTGRTTLALLVLSVLQIIISAEPVSFTFTDTQMFFDISLYNFYLGRDQIYEYILTARQGKQVNLFLFQNSAKQYSIKAYDGVDDQSAEITTVGKIPTNVELVEQPVPLSSAGQNMFVRITADNSNPNVQVDFQAMATDYVQPTAGCSALVSTINSKDKSYTFTFTATAQGCYSIIHANDPTNNPMLQQSLQNGYTTISKNFNVYKGLSTDKKHQLISTNLLSWSSATDKYLVVYLTKNVDLAYYWTFLELNSAVGVNSYSYGVVMTNDYYQNPYPNLPNQLTQTFVLQSFNPVDNIQVNFLNLIGTGTVTASSVLLNVSTEPIVYKAADFTVPFNISYGNCDQVVLKYETDNRQLATGSGFYAMYGDASSHNEFPSSTSSTGLFSNSPVTTAPVQSTATNAVRTTVVDTRTSEPAIATTTLSPQTSKGISTTAMRSTRLSTQQPSTIISSLQPSTVKMTNAPEATSKVVTSQPSTNAHSTAQTTTSSTTGSTSTKNRSSNQFSTTHAPLQSTTNTANYQSTSAILLILFSFLYQLM